MEACKLFNKIVYFFVEKSLGPKVHELDPFVLLKYVALWGGRICLLCFAVALYMVSYVIIFVLVPAEWSTCTNVPWFVLRFIACAYIYCNIIFHYYKARTLEPVRNPGRPGDQFCVSCNNWKSQSTSHCKACDRCIYRMDHHCPHIGQCVGAHNQSHFYLFLVYLLLGTGLFFLFAPTFWLNWLESRKELLNIPPEKCWRPFCFNKYYNLVVYSNTRVDMWVKFTAVLFVMIHWMMWGFVCAYTYIISVGLTMAMRMFQKSDVESRKPFTWETVKARWRRYLNCRELSLWELILIPRSRRPVIYEDYKEMIM